MKRILAVFLTVFCLWMSAAFAEPISGESGAYVNSWRPALQRLAFAQGKLYCLTAEKFLWIDYGVLVAVSNTSTERVLKKTGLKEIVPYQGNILLISREQTLDEALTKQPGGTSNWEVFDPSTRQTTQLMRYYTDTSVESYFVGNDTIFYTTQYTMPEGETNTLYRKNEPENILLYSQTEKMELEYPSYKLLSYVHKTYDPLTQAYHWQNTQVRIFDYVSETVLETNGTILPTNSSTFLQIVLKGRRMYYLSAQGLNVWDFDNDTDTIVLPFEDEQYTRFSLSENTVALFGNGWNMDFYDLSTGELTKTVTLTVYPYEVYLTDQEMYVYDRYSSQMEYINFGTDEHAVFTIR